jgi:hypothetical protein
MGRFSPKVSGVLLVFLSPVIAELCSGSTPFFTFFHPFVILVYLGFYGLGTLIIREVIAHRKLNFSSALLLGGAYGVLEEGIILKSWFDPNWMGASITSKALYVAGTAALEPFSNVVFHVVISITTPILILYALTQSREPWFSKKILLVIGVVFSIAAVGLFTFNARYAIAGWQYLLGILAFAVLAVLGWRGFKFPSGRRLFHPLLLCALGIVFDFLLVTVFYTFSQRGVPWYLILGSAMILYIGYVAIYSRMNWAEGSSRHYFAAATGFVVGLLPLSFSLSRTEPGRVPNVLAELILIAILALTYRTLPRIPDSRPKQQK